MDKLDKLIELLCADDRAPLLERLRRAGITESEVQVQMEDPRASEAIWRASVRRYLLPLVPKILRGLAARAESGDKSAQAIVLGLLGDKSPVKETAGMDLGSVDDRVLFNRASQLAAQLQGIVEDLRSPTSASKQ